MHALISTMLVTLPVLAATQEPPPPARPVLRITGDFAGLTADDRNSHRVWAGQLYSIGAAFCSRHQSLTTCTEVAGRRPVWVAKENDKFCDRNASLTPP